MYNVNDKPELNITPLVDIMLVLLAILMVTAPVIEFEETLNLPTGSKSQQAQDNFLLFSKGKDQNTPIYIRADKDLKYDDIVFVLKSVKEAGFFKVALVTDG